ncbi:MAG: SET domain-containing protein [Ignavibacteriaceae bacterium]|nr:SET domain-containing protein [Ignavibacteriaceae bacterium]
MKIEESNVIVAPSGIHGDGIFTAVDIPEGAKVMVISGEVIDSDECERRENEENNVYIFWNGDNYIDVSMTGKIKYINHNCDANCHVEDRNESSLWLVASRDIKSGEELTIDYGYDEIYESCSCGGCEDESESEIT